MFQPIVEQWLRQNGPVLALDIGSGTQDALLALPERNPENWPRFVLPTPALHVAARLDELRIQQKPVWLHGHNMGGGFFQALRRHLDAGLGVAANRGAAKALYDDPARLRAMGVTLVEQCPEGHVPVYLSEFDQGWWNSLLALCGLPRPALVLAAAQDHGEHATLGNREGRFQLWRNLLADSGGDPLRWVWPEPPAACTRLATLHGLTGGPVADSGAAAVLGAMATPEVQARSQREGVLIVNMGNSHVVAFLLFRNLIYGVYEHHTGMLDTPALLHDLDEFRHGWLPDEQVRASGGHGCVFRENPPEAEGWKPAYILGPRRELLRGQGQFLAPYGDMMLAGCHGLILGAALARARAAAAV